jgi:SAM-dependent methyltransferase
MNPHQRRDVDWPQYLATFHAQHPGITAAVLSRSTYHGRTPYEWLLEGIEPEARILDVACGNAPTFTSHAARWLGLDRSLAELSAARTQTADVVLADATALPIRDDTFDTVISAMALMLITPLGAALRELARVLEPHGTLRALVPAAGPLPWRDRARFALLALNARPQFPPSPLVDDAHDAFGDAGFSVTLDERRCYRYPINTDDDADLLVESLYLPNITSARLQNAKLRVRRWRGHTIGLPLRKIAAIRQRRS